MAGTPRRPAQGRSSGNARAYSVDQSYLANVQLQEAPPLFTFRLPLLEVRIHLALAAETTKLPMSRQAFTEASTSYEARRLFSSPPRGAPPLAVNVEVTFILPSHFHRPPSPEELQLHSMPI